MEPQVLIVDDEPPFLEIEQLYLDKLGLSVTPCGSALEALDEINGASYDIVVSDYQMPEINGIELLKTLRKEGYNLGFILFTGKGREDVAIEALNQGANYYIQKGTDMASQFTLLAGVIDEVWRAQMSAKALAESERLLRISNDRLDLLGSITRHDIRGEISVVDGYLGLADTEPDPARAREHLSKARIATRKIVGILEIARTYQINGTLNIKWASLDEALRTASDSVQMGDLTYTSSAEDWTILVDPLLEMVIANIFSNSVKHGGNVSKIEVSCEERPDGLDLTIEDDGGGIPPGEKERIFNFITPEGVPHGLTIARRILQAERITIKENGTYGKGARFVLHFPRGLYKEATNGSRRQGNGRGPQPEVETLRPTWNLR